MEEYRDNPELQDRRNTTEEDLTRFAYAAKESWGTVRNCKGHLRMIQTLNSNGKKRIHVESLCTGKLRTCSLDDERIVWSITTC